MVCYFSLKILTVLLYYFVFLSRALHELKGEGNTVDQKEVISLTFKNRRPSSTFLTSKLSLKHYKTLQNITKVFIFLSRLLQTKSSLSSSTSSASSFPIISMPF